MQQDREHGATAWTAEEVGAILLRPGHIAPPIGADDFARFSPDLDVWDAWPVQDRDGSPAVFARGATLWMALAAPHREDPDERHGLARIHLFRHAAGSWTHLGPVFPEGFTPGSREWSGSAVLDESGRNITVYFTAAGLYGEPEPTFVQRLFSATGTLIERGDLVSFGDWRDLHEFVPRDARWYMASDAGNGTVGTIKAFRDPAYFFDPKSGAHYVFFAASAADSTSAFNGVIGAAVMREKLGEWRTLPPLVSADGLNNELERPHAIYRDGKYYLFWSTQNHVFDPAGRVGPTGLYGMVAPSLESDWLPLNGTGLVFANPPQAPAQAYSWLVLPDLSVISFVDNWGQAADRKPRRFGASFAPMLKLQLDGTRASLEP